jgi:S1-C subfamily serine protease
MRRGPFLLVLLLAAVASGRAQDKIVEMFDGTTTQTTGTFATQDKWELRWSGASMLTLTLLNPDGTIAAGTTATADGSLYEPKGGTFYLQILGTPAATAKSWHIDVVQLGAGPSTGSITAYTPPATLPPPANKPATPAPPATLTLSTPNPGLSSAGSAIAQVTDAQTRAIVIIKGDLSEGTGFLTHDKEGAPVVITNNHVLFANPNVKITTANGREIPVLAYRGATDRDLVMMTIKDDHYSYLDLAPDVAQLVHEGDEVLTPGNSEGGGVFLDTSGEVRAIGPDRIEISNPIFHGNSGGPVLHVASGKVIGVVYMGQVVETGNLLDAASRANPQSAIKANTRYFAVRVDTVPTWENYDWNRFLTETTFLANFHKQSRLLDSLLNGARYEKGGIPVTSGDEGFFPNSHLYLNDDHLRSLMEAYHEQAHDADKSQQMDAARELCSDLGDYASAGVADIQNPENFYQFNRVRVKEEIAYRKILADELNHVDERISDLGH